MGAEPEEIDKMADAEPDGDPEGLFLVYTMPDVDKERRDLLTLAVKDLHAEAKVSRSIRFSNSLLQHYIAGGSSYAMTVISLSPQYSGQASSSLEGLPFFTNRSTSSSLEGLPFFTNRSTAPCSRWLS